MRHLVLGLAVLAVLCVGQLAGATVVYSENFDSMDTGDIAGQDGWATVSSYQAMHVVSTGYWWGEGYEFVQSAGIVEAGGTGYYSKVRRSLGATYSTGVLTVICDNLNGKEASLAVGDGTNWALIEQGALAVTDIMMIGPAGYNDVNRFGTGNSGHRFKLVIDFDNLTMDGWYESSTANVLAGIFTGTFTQDVITAGFSVDQIQLTQRHGWYGNPVIDNISIDWVPEPVTLSLLAIGALLSLSRRRRS